MDQTFSTDHRDELLRAIGGNLSIDTMGILYRASHSAAFAKDLRGLLREIVRPHVAAEWGDEPDYHWTLTVTLPDGTSDDPYDPDELAQSLRELVDQVEGNELPPTGELWNRAGRLIGHAELIEPDREES
jgi:hypothetical protein